MERYLIYLRKSRADEEAEMRGEGETLARHEKALLELAKRLRLNVTEIYREVVSGETIAARPKMQQLLSEVGQGLWTGVLVMEVERLARGDTMDQGLVAQTFKFSDTKIITPAKTYDPNNEYDEEYFEFGLFMSRREYKTINRRLQRGRVASVKEGKYVANRPPYGYNRVKLEHEKGFTLEAHPEEAEVVKLIYEWYTKGIQDENGVFTRLGCTTIAHRLNDMSIPPKRGSIWTTSTIRDILCNPVYIGKVRWGRRALEKKMDDGQIVKYRPRSENYLLVDGLHKPIISVDTYQKSQEIYASNHHANPNPAGTITKNPLSGLIVCGICGRRMVRRPYPDNRPSSLICRESSCPNVGSYLDRVERRVLDALREWMETYRVNWKMKPESDDGLDSNNKALSVLKKEEEKLSKQLYKIHDLLEQDIYTVDEFLNRSKAISSQLENVQSNIKTIEKKLHQEQNQKSTQEELIPKIEALLDVYDTLPSAQAKNNMLKQVIEKVVYTKKSSGRWHGSPDNFQLVLYPKVHKDTE